MSDNSDIFVVPFEILTIAALQRIQLGQAAHKTTLLLKTGHACIIILYFAPSDHDRMRPTRDNSMRIARSSNSGAILLIGIVLKWDTAMDMDSDVHTIKRLLPNCSAQRSGRLKVFERLHRLDLFHSFIDQNSDRLI
jgi:hypothetical protein